MENTNERKQINRDGATLSAWQKVQLTAPKATNTLNDSTIYDALIVGGGITGITTALLLQKQGKQVVLAEAHTLGFGTTGGTTAHLNTFFDTPYNDIESDFNEDAAKLVAQCGKEAFDIIKGFVPEYHIECDLELKDGYLYAETDEEAEILDQIFEASKRAGVDVQQSTTNGINVPFKKSIVFKDQGQFHPIKYIYGLAGAFIEAGGIILENTFIRDSSYQDGVLNAQSDNINIKAKKLVYATHLPPGVNLLDFVCAPYRSYVIGLKLKEESAYPDCLSYDSKEPYHYFRTHVINNKKYLIVGGEDHKTGHDSPEAAFKALEDYATQYYESAEIKFKWSAQYYTSADGLAYIGNLPSNNDIYIATGYNGNGMMYGTISGKIISDMILDKQSPYADLFSPIRIKPVAGFTEFVKENADVAYRFIADRFSSAKIDSLKDIKAGTGAIVKYDGEQLAVYKDAEGKVTALNPACTHAKCIVCFNPSETSWDCPCHGGRFDIHGKVLTGPPRADLEQIPLK